MVCTRGIIHTYTYICINAGERGSCNVTGAVQNYAKVVRVHAYYVDVGGMGTLLWRTAIAWRSQQRYVCLNVLYTYVCIVYAYEYIYIHIYAFPRKQIHVKRTYMKNAPTQSTMINRRFLAGDTYVHTHVVVFALLHTYSNCQRYVWEEACALMHACMHKYIHKLMYPLAGCVPRASVVHAQRPTYIIVYFQIVWGETTTVGCAMSKCATGASIWVCKYGYTSAGQSHVFCSVVKKYSVTWCIQFLLCMGHSCGLLQ
jgi:hypothetical protein